MDPQVLLSVALFTMVTTGTPGPNNMMLTASGANFGYWRSLPHMIGIVVGVTAQSLLIAAGLGALFQQFPLLQVALKLLASVYLLYLAWKIATAGAARLDSASEARPQGWFGAALFQFLNPKAWMMTITLIGSFTLAGADYWNSVLWVVSLFMLISFPCISLWAAFGTLVGRLLATPAAWRGFNWAMGTLTAACLLFIW